jgi:hypothetical protein
MMRSRYNKKRCIVFVLSGILAFALYRTSSNICLFLESIYRTSAESFSNITEKISTPTPMDASYDNSIASNSISNTRDSKPSLPLIDLVVILSGELGNNLLKIAFGKIIQCFALEEGMFNFSLRFVSQGLRKSISARHDVEQCFSKHFSPNLVNLAEWKLNSADWKEIVDIQTTVIERFYQGENDDPIQAIALLQITNPYSFDTIRHHLENLQDILYRMNLQKQIDETRYNDFFISNSDADGREITEIHNLSLPFLIANAFPVFSLLDRYWEEISELFTFSTDEQRCCSTKPEVDETVLHIRGFDVEMPNVYNNLGFRELNPHQTSTDLLAHLKAGDKVAIVSRFDERSLANFTGALVDRGLHVRFITGLSGVQGFCFLKSAYKELVGGNRSTYFLMASMLNDHVSNVTIFCLNYAGVLCNPDHTITNKKLSRIQWNFPIFQAERRILM